MKMAVQLIRDMSGAWKPSDYADKFTHAIHDRGAARQAGKTEKVTSLEGDATPATSNFVDLAELLKKSLREARAVGDRAKADATRTQGQVGRARTVGRKAALGPGRRKREGPPRRLMAACGAQGLGVAAGESLEPSRVRDRAAERLSGFSSRSATRAGDVRALRRRRRRVPSPTCPRREQPRSDAGAARGCPARITGFVARVVHGVIVASLLVVVLHAASAAPRRSLRGCWPRSASSLFAGVALQLIWLAPLWSGSSLSARSIGNFDRMSIGLTTSLAPVVQWRGVRIDNAPWADSRRPFAALAALPR